MCFPFPYYRMILPVSFIATAPPTNHITLQKFSTWQILLNAATIRSHERILKQAEELKEEETPALQYHRQCYQQFTHKSSLNVLTKKHEKTKEKFQTIMQNISTYETDKGSLKPKRTSSSSSSSTLLPQGKCVFCDKTKKYKSKKAENFRTCDLKQVKEKIEQCAKDIADHRIIAITSKHDLIAAEAKYHPSCYTNFTRPKKTSVSSTSSGKCQETDDYKRVELKSFKIAVERFFNTVNQCKVFKFQELLSIMTTHL